MIQKIEVLIADDNRLSRELIKAVLEKYGATFTEATTGHEVLELTENRKFDVIFQDFLMPDYNGLELSRTIRERKVGSSNAYIIGISAATELTEHMCRTNGMNMYVSKPFNIAKLREIFEAAIGTKAVQNNNHNNPQ